MSTVLFYISVKCHNIFFSIFVAKLKVHFFKLIVELNLKKTDGKSLNEPITLVECKHFSLNLFHSVIRKGQLVVL